MTHFVPGSSKAKLYQAICQLLSDRYDEIAWGQFALQDWTELVRMAGEEGVAPLLYRKLSENKSQLNFPTGISTQIRDVHQRLATDYYKWSAQNQLLFAELGRILNALENVEAGVIVLKGAALGMSVYPDLALRPMNDLDLLVDKHSLDKGVETIRTLGYKVDSPEHLGMGSLGR